MIILNFSWCEFLNVQCYWTTS